MRTISYGGESFTTTNDAAEALLQFAAAAALNDFADVVHIPAVDADGNLITADLVIGPSSELFVIPSHSLFDEPDTTAEVAILRKKTADLGLSRHLSHGAPLGETERQSSVDPTELPELG